MLAPLLLAAAAAPTAAAGADSLALLHELEADVHELSAQLERKTDKLFNARGLGGLIEDEEAAKEDFLDVLAECGEAEVKYRSEHGTTVLMKMAQFHDWPDEISHLIMRGSLDVNAQSKSGATALHHAAKNNRRHTVLELLNLYADPSIKTHGARGKTAADYARMEGHPALAKMLDETAERWINQQEIMKEHDEDEDGDVYYKPEPWAWARKS